MKESLLQLFPINRRGFWKSVAGEEGKIQEIRLRVNLPVIVIRNGKEVFLDEKGCFTDKSEASYIIEEQELEDILQHICHYSVYAFEDELRQGFITVAGGHRVGIAGQVVLETDGSVRSMKHISYMNIRVSHQIKGAADSVLPYIYESGALLNTLIISPPSCGKTTLLRDLVRQVSDGNSYGKGKCVGVVDERSEIAGCFAGKPQNDLGMRTDVLDACPKALGMMILLRSMSPQVIAVDELGGNDDIAALCMAASCGSRILATIHGESIEDVRKKAGMKTLFEQNMFQCFITLGRKNGKCVVESILGGENANVTTIGVYHDNNRMSGIRSLVSPTVCQETLPSSVYGNHSRDDDERSVL